MMNISARQVAGEIYAWAERNGYLVGYDTAPQAERVRLQSAVAGLTGGDDLAAERLIERVDVSGVTFDEEASVVTVLTAGHLGPRNAKSLPREAGSIMVNWIGSAQIQHNPLPLPAQPPASKKTYLHNGRIACGSSVTAAISWGAGSLGCFVRDGDGDLCGLTNNHVTGGCNHMAVGMPILIPAPIDASPTGPEPRTIGRHKTLVKIDSGNPQVVSPQCFDAATFKIADPDAVSSMQGPGNYDTPSHAGPPGPQQRVKKIGRTTELTRGTVLGPFISPIAVPYKSQHFNATVYLRDMLGVAGDNNEMFSQGGDSGSLVVSEDGNQAIGLIVGSMHMVSLVMPLEPLMKSMGLSLVSGHNV